MEHTVRSLVIHHMVPKTFFYLLWKKNDSFMSLKGNSRNNLRERLDQNLALLNVIINKVHIFNVFLHETFINGTQTYYFIFFFLTKPCLWETHLSRGVWLTFRYWNWSIPTPPQMKVIANPIVPKLEISTMNFKNGFLISDCLKMSPNCPSCYSQLILVQMET